MTKKSYTTNINCGGCIATVAPYLEKVEGLISWQVDTQSKDKTLDVTLAGDDDGALIAAVQSAGFTIKPVAKGFFARFGK